MGVFSLFKNIYFLSAYLISGSRGLTLASDRALGSPDSLLTVPINVSLSHSEELCTDSLIWTGSTGFDAEFTDDCYNAWSTFLMTDFSTSKGTIFEFSHQGVPSSFPGMAQMATPRRYIKSESITALQSEFVHQQYVIQIHVQL